MELSDSQLIVAVLEGDERSFKVIIERHLGAVYNFAYRYLRDPADAEDIAQETFVRAWKNLKKFDTSKSFKTWIFTIAKNASLDFIKKKKATPFSHIAEDEAELDAILAPHMVPIELSDVTMDQKILAADMGNMLHTLPPAYRMVLALRYNDHLKFREIAETLGEPIDTVKSKHRRGLALLRKVFFA